MKKEIGGYMEMETYYGQEFHDKALSLNSGRHCLEYLIYARKIRKLFIPYYMCDTAKDICHKTDCQYEFYHIAKDFRPLFNRTLKQGEYLYLVNYFGQLSNTYIEELKNKFPNLIVDNCQSFFQHPVKDVYTIYTCRKYFGVSVGAYLYTNSVSDNPLPPPKINHINVLTLF